ncbi:GNAT family N-acetyltransferase [Vibrio sp. ZSDE26]|uniref:GNAT family N-acetyltransferase n=1 Tax=Vibrio amylolyticus TaxID=2847292 RepID=A0A9X2BHC9_9VIBR|nr:GNAT family protein [Vibrio amylolyticus]MCK6262805.1 GNAT family N-acetyltransferase [Vibrio amylolyticus]
MTPKFTLSTQRLSLRLIEHDEAEKLRELVVRSPSLHQWIDWCTPTFSLKDSERFLLATRLNWVKGDAFGFGLFRHNDGMLVGMVAINELYHTFNMASMGYWVSDQYQHQGYAKEAVQKVIEFCFDLLKVTRIELVCDPQNEASHALAASCGAEKESVARNRFIFDGQPKDGLIFSLIPPSSQ